MRILLAEYAHESNCFAVDPTTQAAFEEGDLMIGAAALCAHRGRTGVVSGFINVLEEAGHEVVVAVTASAFPAGPIEAGFHNWVCDTLAATAADSPWDGVLLSLHGAMAVDPVGENPDPEGMLTARVRDIVGPDCPIGVVLDPHSDTSEVLLEAATFTLAYNEEPHRDVYARGREAAKLFLRVAGGLRLVTARRRVPMILPAINMATDMGPMHTLHTLRAAREAAPGIVDVSIHGGFYGSDQPEAGFGVVVTAEEGTADPAEVAEAMAAEAWALRDAFLVDLVSPEDAVAQALAADVPVGLIDEADDPAGGATCDSVLILKAMVAGGVASGGVSTIFDAEVAHACAAAGEGAEIDVRLGAKLDPRHGAPFQARGTVARVHRGAIPFDGWTGKTYDPGIVAALRIGSVLTVVTERKLVTENIDIFETLGFDVTEMQAIAFKGLGLHVRQALAGKVDTFLPVDGDGSTHPDVRRLGTFAHIRRPVWPLDDLASVEAVPGLIPSP